MLEYPKYGVVSIQATFGDDELLRRKLQLCIALQSRVRQSGRRDAWQSICDIRVLHFRSRLVILRPLGTSMVLGQDHRHEVRGIPKTVPGMRFSGKERSTL